MSVALVSFLGMSWNLSTVRTASKLREAKSPSIWCWYEVWVINQISKYVVINESYEYDKQNGYNNLCVFGLELKVFCVSSWIDREI